MHLLGYGGFRLRLVLQGLRSRILVFGRASFGTPSADGWNVGFPPLLEGAVRLWGEFDQGMQGYIHPGASRLVLLHEVGIDAAENGLVSDDEDVLTPLELHDDGLKTDNNVAIRLSAAISVIVLVFIARSEILGVAVLNLLIRQAVTDARIKLVKGLPLQLVVMWREKTCSCNGAFQGRCPDGKGPVVLLSC